MVSNIDIFQGIVSKLEIPVSWQHYKLLWYKLSLQYNESRLLFMLLDHCRGALVCCLLIDWSVCVAPMHLEQACCAALVNQNMKRIVT